MDSSDDRIAIAAATAILDRGFGRPTQAIDTNITQDGGPIRYYAELPRKDASAEAWSERVGPAGTGTPPKRAESAEAWLKDIGMLCADSAEQPSDRPSPGFSYGQPDGEIAVSDTRLTNDEARRISKLITRLPELVELEKSGTRTAAGGHFGVPTTLTAPEVLASMYLACKDF